MKKKGKKNEERSFSEKSRDTHVYKDHLQTMTTGRGTDIEGSSNVYNSVLSDRDTLLSNKKSTK